jgi:transcription initiation factor IIE alpha subunit
VKKETTKALEKETQMKGDIYVCSMCPSVKLDKPGKCPECGMALEKMKPSDKIIAMYSCPMHTEITSGREGKCSKCGMALEKIKTSIKDAKAEKHSKMNHDIYGCSMHPDVKSDKQGKCPKCGMNLEKLKKGN